MGKPVYVAQRAMALIIGERSGLAVIRVEMMMCVCVLAHAHPMLIAFPFDERHAYLRTRKRTHGAAISIKADDGLARCTLWKVLFIGWWVCLVHEPREMEDNNGASRSERPAGLILRVRRARALREVINDDFLSGGDNNGNGT